MKQNRLIQSTITMITMLLMFTGCNRGSNNNKESYIVAKDTTKTVIQKNSEIQMEMERAIVLDRVKNIFRVVSEDQRSMSGFVMSGLCDRAFCSKSWNELMMAVKRKEYLTSTLFFEIDYWTMTRDPELVTFEEFEVTKLVMDDHGKSASVSFVVYEPDTFVPARVDMIYENGRWVIDNFYDLRYMLNLRHCMWNYLNHDIL